MRNLFIAATTLAIASVSSAAGAADASFVFTPVVEYSVSINLDNQSRCTLPAESTPPDGTKCTINFDGSGSHTFEVRVANGYQETFAYSPGMPVHEFCILVPINDGAGLTKMIRCSDADSDDDSF